MLVKPPIYEDDRLALKVTISWKFHFI